MDWRSPLHHGEVVIEKVPSGHPCEPSEQYDIYIYIYMCVCECVCVCVCVYLGSISSLMHISLNNIDMFCLHIFVYVLSQLIDWFYGIRWQFFNETPITNCYPSTFCPILDYHQGCVYCKSDVTFACTLLFWNCLLLILVYCCCVLFLNSSL